MNRPTPPSRRRPSCLTLLCTALWACTGGPQGGSLISPRDGGSGEAQSCEPDTSQACYCPDGTKSGTQQCDAEGILQACACDSAPVPDPSAAALCPEITGDCTAETYVSRRVPISMLFVIDRSRSMACNLPPVQSSAECEQTPTATDREAPTKWSVTTDALRTAFEALPSSGATAGLSFFSVNNTCGVDSAPAVDVAPLMAGQLNAMDAALADTNPGGQTPIVGATILAYAHLHQEIQAAGNRFVVLLTDGAESCAEDSVSRLLDEELDKAREANIRTFVIGAPGSENARAFLSELAFRGGTASTPGCAHDIQGPADQGDCHFDMTREEDFAGALAAAFGEVEAAAVSCEFSVPGGGAIDVNVQYTPGQGGGAECFAKDDTAPCEDGANGWQFARDADGSEDRSRVVLCGNACERVRSDPGARIDILVGCQVIQII